jgi:EmrB/QacA subfamily drug resistance transporter
MAKRELRGNDPDRSALALSGARGRWVLAATVLGSSLALVDATVVNIALPAIGRDLHAGVTALTWTVNAYTLTLAALILLGGSLGDRLGRRKVFLAGVALFGLASLGCAIAPSTVALVIARAVQGVGGAMLTPGSLAIIQATFRSEDRARAIGAWSGLGGVAAAVAPLLGGWLVGTWSWRLIFVINLPLVVVVIAIAVRHVPETRDPGAARRIDHAGALLATAGLGLVSYGLSAWPRSGTGSVAVLLPLLAGLAVLGAFVVVERLTREPMLPLGIFASRPFTVTNIVTLLVYAGLGGVFFWLVVTLQVVVGDGPIQAGLSLLPVTVFMLAFSARAGVLAERIGPRPLMAAGPLLAAVGVAALARVGPGSSFLVDVLVPVAVLAAGLTLTVTPLTTTALGSVPAARAGLASAVNNAVARTGGLLVVAALPAITGLGPLGFGDPAALAPAFRNAMIICAVLLALGGTAAAVFLPRRVPATRPPEEAPTCPRRHCAVDATPLGQRRGE